VLSEILYPPDLMYHFFKGGETIIDYKKEVYWNKFAHTFNEDQTYIVGISTQQGIIKRLSEEHDLGEVIEFGCGAGYFTKVIAKNATHITATDFSNEMLAMARAQLKDLQNVNFEKADCKKTTFPSGKFDTVFMANLIHVIENPSKTLKEGHRILKDDGSLLLVDYTMHGMRGFEKMKSGIRYLRKWGKPPSYFRGNLSPNEFKLIVESAGFKVNKAQVIGNKINAIYLKGKKK